MLKYLNDSNFSEETKKGVSIVDFYADWCGPCKMMAPVMEQLGSELSEVNVCKVNVEENPALSAEFGVRSIPTFIVFKDGKPVEQLMGAMSKQSLVSILEKNK